jgi:hypothetical protein
VLETAHHLANKSKASQDTNLFHKIESAFAYLKETAVACLCGELLKLGIDKIDKKLCKELIRNIGLLGWDWLRQSQVRCLSF